VAVDRAAAVVVAAAAVGVDREPLRSREGGGRMFLVNRHSIRAATGAPIAALALFAAACSSTPASKEASYASPEQAVRALAEAAASGDAQRIDAVLGADGSDLLSSGDPVADRADGERVQELLSEKLALEPGEDGSTVAVLGNEGWTLPIPMVQDGKKWRFDVDAGRDEVTNRRVGRNEISTIATLHAFVDAQQEYISRSRDGRSPMYAQRVMSQPGQHDGLYWETKEGEPDSPLGPLVAQAAEEGYGAGKSEGTYHGYRYRVLRSQGSHAPGGAKNYVDASGNMTGGFAAIAWPAKYGNSGVMTFIVNQRGMVFEKDLGDDTETAVQKITSFDPDASWTPTGD
jgi:hypothetical protein